MKTPLWGSSSQSFTQNIHKNVIGVKLTQEKKNKLSQTFLSRNACATIIERIMSLKSTEEYLHHRLHI